MNTQPFDNPWPAGSRPRVLVTGGAGFIGSHLIDALLIRWPSCEITVVDDLSTGRIENLDPARRAAADSGASLEIVERSIQDTLPELSSQPEFHMIFHLAAAVGVQRVVSDPIGCIETNVDATAALLRYAVAHGKPATLLASSSEVYGKSASSPFCEDDDCLYGPTTSPRWSYGASKAIDEYLALAHHQQNELPVVVARLFNTVGPRQIGDYGMVLPRFVKAAISADPITVYGDGTQTRCFCDVRDVAPALIDLLLWGSAARDGETGRVFNLGKDEPISIRELAETVKSQTASASNVAFVPFDRAMGSGFEDLPQRRPSLERLRAAISFEPKIPLAQTVQDIADSLRLAHAELEGKA